MVRRMVCAAVFLTGGWASAFAAEGGHGDAAPSGSSLITPQVGLIFWTTLTFVILLLLLGRFAWKPLLGAIEARERGIRDALDQARREREEAAALLQQHRELINQARRERAEVVAEGQKDAARLKAEILDEAKKQRELVLQQTEAQVKSMVRQAKEELRGMAADLAIQAAGKLIGRNLDDSVQRKLVEDYLSDLERFPGERSAGA